ncbi:hypothetical protein HHI36_003561 [Cryptolaemus montrouzieri]|uniref:UDP-glucuronosyltransferase n=1 Tax=Cryptolaemus montrouzieri TaxID=559131 RepID=A0ABD2PEH7_9CUCU
MNQKWLLMVMAFLCTQVEAAKILGLFWTFGKSHHIAGSALLKELAKAGHEVHLLSTFKDDVDIPNFKQELLVGDVTPGSDYSNPNNSLFSLLFRLITIMNKNADSFWKNDAVQNLIETKPKYDAVIVLTFFNDFVLALPKHLDAPTIVFSSLVSNALNNKFVGNPNLPYVKGLLSDAPLDTFVGRLAAVCYDLILSAVDLHILAPSYNRLNKKYLPETPSIEELTKNVSLVLVNSHFAVEGPRPSVPNMVQIGGFHAENSKKLPENLQKFLDSAEDGAIVFSLGTNVKLSKNFGKSQFEAVIKGLGKVAPIKVLFKSEIEIPTAPQNVLVAKWFPQNDILAHPNIKLFISHGGLGGTTEAVFHGVPVLGIPFFADQKTNVASIVDAGLALMLSVDEINEETFDAAIKELLTNPKYTANAKKRSSLLKEQPVSSLGTPFGGWNI